MSNYFLPEQVGKLLEGINPARVGKDKRGNSHVEAYEIKAHLNRMFGFGRWSGDVLEMECIENRGEGGRYWAAYRAQYRLTVCAPDGTVLCTYTEWAVGKSDNQPSLGDCHDMAVKTAESQALKRAAINLGDQFGLGLYAKGKLSRLVGLTLFRGGGGPGRVAASVDVDKHITEALPAEEELEFSEPVEKAEPRTVNTPQDAGVAALAAAADKGPEQDQDIKQFYAKLRARAAATGVKKVQVGDTGLSLEAYIDMRQGERLAAR